MRQLFSDVFHRPLSEGSIDNILEGMSKKSDAACKAIQARIAKSEVAGADETGCHVNGKKHWFHVWQTKMLTFIVAFKSRGHQVFDEYFRKVSCITSVTVGHPGYRPGPKVINCALPIYCRNC